MIGLTGPIEGYFIETPEDYIFEIKGIVHPKDRLTAYLRYVPSSEGERERGGEYYRKIPMLTDRDAYLLDHSPHYVWYDNIRGRNVQSVPFNSISIVYDPMDALGHMRDGGGHLNMLQKLTVDLCEYLVEISGVSSDAIGVTGSQLVGLSTKDSDIDLVVYGMKAGQELFSALSDLSYSTSALHRYSGDELMHHTKFRWGDQNPMLHTLMDMEREKVLQGLYNSKDVFIRLVKTPSEIGWKYGDREYRNMGVKTARCCIIDDSDSIYTPCRYVVECEEIPELKEIVSYRGRYTEHAKNGMWVTACGRLEKVTEKNEEIYQHIVLGESFEDFMLPSKSL